MHVRCSDCGHPNAVKDFVITSLKSFFACSSCKSPQALTIVVEPSAALVMSDDVEAEREGKRGRTLNKLSLYFKDVFHDQEEVFTPVLPAMVGEIMVLVNDPSSDAQRIARSIERDQVVAAKVLRMANSAFYQGMNKIGDLGKAIARLGLKEVTGVVLGSVAADLHRSKGMTFDYLMDDLWDHALMCGVACREIAKKINYPATESAFIAGLLHDIGKVVLLGIGSEAADGKIETETPVTEELLMEVLAEVHCEVGQSLMQRWDMPDELFEAVGNHHEPWHSSAGDKLPQIVNLADFFCKKLSHALKPDPSVNLAGQRSAETLGLNEIALADIEVELEEKTVQMKEVL